MSTTRNSPPFTLKVEIPWLPKSLNRKLRAGWRANASEMKSWACYLSAELHSRRPKIPLARARIRIVRHAHRTLDFDGLVGSLKPVVDGLVGAGIIADDSWAVTGAWDIDQQFRSRKAGPLLTIEVYEVLT